MKTAMISNALEEVWEWKKRCYEEAKNMTVADYLKKIHIEANHILREAGFGKNAEKQEN